MNRESDLANAKLAVGESTKAEVVGRIGLPNRVDRKDVAYLFEVTSSNIYGNAVGYGMVVVGMTTQMRIIDLRSEQVVWSHQAWSHELYQMGGDLKKLEENNLAKLKEGVTVGLGEVLSREQLGPNFGIVAEK